MTPSSETPPAVTGYAGERSEPAESNSKDHPMPPPKPIDTLVSEIRAAAEAATQSNVYYSILDSQVGWVVRGDGCITIAGFYHTPGADRAAENAAFYAKASPANILTLTTEIERLTGKLVESEEREDRLTAALDWALEEACAEHPHYPEHDGQGGWQFPYLVKGEGMGGGVGHEHHRTALEAVEAAMSRAALTLKGRSPNTIEVGKPLPYFCPACQAIPRDGYCKLAGCPTAPDLKGRSA